MCDARNDCGDNSDETKCGSSKFENVFVHLIKINVLHTHMYSVYRYTGSAQF